MRSTWIILFLALPFTGFAQYAISGRVINKSDRQPVADASVFLNNATVGTKTADNGTFTLTNVRPGQYDLVVSIIGFETVHQNIMVNKDLQLPDILFTPKTIALKEVKIMSPDDRDKYYQKFKRLFLGVSDFAADCKILNPDLLDFDFDRTTKVFSASSSDYLEIENRALGYRIKYFLNDFKNDEKSGIFYFEGTAAFSEMKGGRPEMRKWQKNRLKVYLGSSMHFLRSAIANNLQTEGFRVLRLIRTPDTAKSLTGIPRFKETLVTKPYLNVNDFIHATEIQGEYALGYPDCLYVMYAKKWAHQAIKNPAAPQPANPAFLDDPVATTLIFDRAYSYFDENGIIINPQSVLFEGSWGTSRVAELLPVDYVPGEVRD
ncbi:carboxypeptidase-like regulatory domain-containing protein [Mucilaginibacter sp.]|uniref:carboxypeptidase-like regulatory domain-containing protein n=1 Tax=Mucilaginibacter sp. TaxID=1882438 RepID=UPI0028407DED|nr:carboxypeptidase-like regulatory domain-containing protein [Mucilaginibacter sp.]MDR3694554.1 carboxypeptidase-like regulatory domain-containing protein [Mucilaginibacter sp.]